LHTPLLSKPKRRIFAGNPARTSPPPRSRASSGSAPGVGWVRLALTPHGEKAMSLKIWIDGNLVDKEDAKISVYDHGLLYGDGVFEGIRAYNGKIFEEEAHL